MKPVTGLLVCHKSLLAAWPTIMCLNIQLELVIWHATLNKNKEDTKYYVG